MSKFAPHHRSSNNVRATSSTVCQKCLGSGHFTYQCKSTAAPYVSRPSRTQMLEKPSLLAKMRAEGKPSVEVPEEFKSKSGTANKILSAKEKEREKGKEPAKKRRKRSGSPSSSSDSDSDSDSSSGSSSDSDSDSDSSSDSGSDDDGSRRRKTPRRRDSSGAREKSRSRSPRRR
ncbi:unnamed protein product [Peniophora sp. CBMAI 1063]|nr:unnamed protein product [Peniophora sp. CBMAI 1063]